MSVPSPTIAASTRGTDLAVDLARFATAITLADLDADVVSAVKTNILDTLACAIAGSSAVAISDVAGLVKSWGGAPQADMWVFGGKYPAHHAAWINGSMAHARDYDDTHDDAVLHAGVTTVPAALAMAQLRGGVSGADLIASVAAGLELTCRLGLATKPTIIESGFIYTPLFGYFGATAAAGRIMNLTPEQMINALGIVYSSVAGNHQVTRDASHMKRFQPGLAAQAAVVAVQMAQLGVRGVQNVFEGVDGFFRIYFNNKVNADVIRDDLGRRFDTVNLSYKPYPCCRANHSAVDATLKLREKHLRPVTDVESIRVGVTAQGYQIVCTPEEIRRSPKTVVQAQFSIPYTVASAWADGELKLRHFTDDGLKRDDILSLAKRVHPYVDDELNRERTRGVTQGKVSITFKDGTTVEARVDDATGHPKNPMSDADFLAKAEDCIRFSANPLPAGTAQRLLSAVDGLDRMDDVSQLVSVIV